MGLFQQLVKTLFKSNFTRIAENTTKYYLELTRNYSNRFYDEVILLATVGILDAQVYIFAERSIELETILAMARAAVSSEEASLDISTYKRVAMGERLRKYRRKRSSAAAVELLVGEETKFEEDPLFNFVFSLEVELFAVDSRRFSRADIEWSCYTKANTISNAIRKTKEKYNSEVPFALATANLMGSPKFEAIRKQLGIRG